MSAGKNRSDLVVCPYFSACEKQAMYCEGPEENSRIRLTFSHPSRFVAYRKEFCEGDWKRCRIAQMNEDKWRDYYEIN